MAQFKESEHPRDSDGKFTNKGKGTTTTSKLRKAFRKLKKRVNIGLVFLEAMVKEQ
ncbi:MAG: hypothetical protein IJD42_04960 [Clostridia bacterium]|nr:hypothetical protein [Clostridia bacterium]